jgi:hypothetical protein
MLVERGAYERTVGRCDSVRAFGWRILGVTLGQYRRLGRRAERLGFA